MIFPLQNPDQEVPDRSQLQTHGWGGLGSGPVVGGSELPSEQQDPCTLTHTHTPLQLVQLSLTTWGGRCSVLSQLVTDGTLALSLGRGRSSPPECPDPYTSVLPGRVVL